MKTTNCTIAQCTIARQVALIYLWLTPSGRRWMRANNLL